jgi:hypothetical protein
MSITRIGRCVGCGVVARMVGPHADACTACLARRGERWLELARRVRTDPGFAARVYEHLPVGWRKRFVDVYGSPTAQE